MLSGKIRRKISLKRKIFQYLLFTTFFSLILLGAFWIDSEIMNFKKEAKVLKNSFSETKKLEIKNKILEIKDWIYWTQRHPPESIMMKLKSDSIDTFSRPEYLQRLLQDYCLDSLSRVRYAEDEYIFINTLDGKALISNGKINKPPVDIFMTGDTSWINIFKVEQLAESQSGGRFHSYPFKKISENKTSEKTSFFSYLPEWSWIIGTGYYEDDFNSIIELKRKALFQKLKQNLLNFAPFFLFSILLSYLIVLFFSRRLAINFGLFKDFFSKAVSEHNLIDSHQLSYYEFEVLAETANKMLLDSLKAEASLKISEEKLKLHREHLEELVIQRTAEFEKEKEHAQSADRLKSAFLATMSHELRTPLNSIIGFSGILMQERPGPLNDEQKKQLGMVQNSARHLLSLINDVLDISKIEAGQLKMNLQPFNLPDLINKVVETNRPFSDKKNLRINVSIDGDIKNITSDNLRIQQILLNLVNNSIKFTETGSIRIRCFTVSGNVKIQISDTGIGIESEKIDQMFKPFMQIDTGLTRKHEGTGLGLSICKKLIEMLNGKIEVESKYGVGSTFSITLPINQT